MKNIIYLRNSDEKQEMSCEVQLKEIKSKGYTPDIVIEEKDVSGNTPIHKRIGLVEGLAQIKSGDKFICYSLDRLSRDLMNYLFIEKEIKKNGGELVTIREESFCGDDPTSVLMRQIVSVYASYELNLIKMRTRLALETKKIKGEKTGGIRPFGYQVEMDGDTKVLVPFPAEMKTLDKMKSWKNSGMTYKSIVEKLNNDNIPSTTGGSWCMTSVYKIMKRAS